MNLTNETGKQELKAQFDDYHGQEGGFFTLTWRIDTVGKVDIFKGGPFVTCG